MRNNEIRDALLLSLAPELKLRGYVLNKSSAEFTKKLSDGWHKFQLIFLERSHGWEINPGMLIRNDIVEKIYHQASYFESKYHKNTPTIGITAEKIINDGNEYRFQLDSKSDVEHCSAKLLAIFEEIAEPFFWKYSNIKNIESIVNDEGHSENDEFLFSGPMYRGHLGIILAKLVNNPRYSYLEQKYRNYYEWFSNGFYLPEYEGVLRVLSKL